MSSQKNNSGTIGIFGYGSLVNLASLEQTIGRKPQQISYVSVAGWNRAWNVVVANNSPRGRFYTQEGAIPEYVLALNIEATDDLAGYVNGILFDASDEEIERLDERETHYDRVDITDSVTADHGFDTIYTYVGKSQYIAQENISAIIPASYVETVRTGFISIDEAAYEYFLQTTVSSNFQTVPTTYVLL